MSLNKVILIGNLTKQPELKQTPSGLSVCTFSIAVNRKFKTKEGKQEVDYFNIVTWRRSAETAAQYLSKGSSVAISGSIQNRSYEANDGTKRYITEIISDEVQFLKTDKTSTQSQTKNVEETMTEVTDFPDSDDLPF